MPIYSYTCEHCNTMRDVLCRHGDPAIIPCQTCGKMAMERDAIQQPPTIQFVGSGWPGQDHKLQAARERSGDITDSRAAYAHAELTNQYEGDE